MRRVKQFDSLGRPVTDVETEPGFFQRDLDERAVATLGASALSLQDAAMNGVRPSFDLKGRNPYGRESATKTLRTRSGLDYMRALSVEFDRRRRRTRLK